jgi:hypothetical protein
MRTRVKKNPLPYRPIGAYRTSTRYRAFDEARECILNPKTRCLTADEPAFGIAEKHFFDMFRNPDPNMRDGREQAKLESANTRYSRGTPAATIANWQATQGIQEISLSVLYVRANAFVNMMDAYICYLTGLVKLVVPEGHAQEAAPPPDAPELPPGFAWAEVRSRVLEAMRMMENAGAYVFGLEEEYHPVLRADYLAAVRALAEDSLRTRGLSVGTDRVGVFVRDSNKAAQAFAVAFLEADTIVKTATAEELRQLKYDQRDQMKARQRIQKTEPGLRQSRSRAAAEETPEQKKAMAAAGSLLAASDSDEFLRDMGAQTASAAATRPDVVPAASRPGSIADLMSFDDDPELVNLNNPRDRSLRTSRSPMTRYPRVH